MNEEIPTPSLVKPENTYKQLSILHLCVDGLLSILFMPCVIFLPFPIIALVKSNSVETLWNAGKQQEAITAAKLSRKLNIIGFVLTALCIVIPMIALLCFLYHEFGHNTYHDVF